MNDKTCLDEIRIQLLTESKLTISFAHELHVLKCPKEDLAAGKNPFDSDGKERKQQPSCGKNAGRLLDACVGPHHAAEDRATTSLLEWQHFHRVL